VSTATFLMQRERVGAVAPAAAAALRGGEPGPAAALLQGWRFAGDAGHMTSFLRALVDAPLAPDPRAMAATLDPALKLQAPTALRWRELAGERASATVGQSILAELDAATGGAGSLAWALAELALLADCIETHERGPWGGQGLAATPAEDAVVAELWRCWTEGRPWDARAAWEKRFLSPALRAFSAVVRARRLPEDVRARALDDAREGFFYALLGDGRQETGWRELAVRLLEDAGGGPDEALARALPASAWDRVARCAVTRGHGPATAALVWGEGSAWQLQARDLAQAGLQQPERLAGLLDLHVASRLVDRWAEPASTAAERSWAVVAHNRGRARSRLRAVLRESEPEHLLARLVALPGLAARTRAAVARYARDWAWQQVQHGFSFYDGRTIDPPCHLPEGAPPPFDADQQAALRAWVTVVVVKGRLGWLRQWVHGGSQLDARDSTWGRLLKDECPATLRELAGASRAEGLARLRADLSEQLDRVLRQVEPVLEGIAQIEARPRETQARFEAALAPVAHPLVAIPGVARLHHIEAARQALVRLRAERAVEGGAGGLGSDDPGFDDPGSDDPGSDDPGSDDPGSDDPGSDDPDTCGEGDR